MVRSKPGGDPSHDVGLVDPVCLDEAVDRGLHHDRLGLDLVAHRIGHVLVDDVADLIVECGREQHRAMVTAHGRMILWTCGRNPMLAISSASSMTTVSTRRGRGLAIDEVDEASRCGHDDLGATLRRSTWSDRHASVDRHDLEATGGHERLERLRHLGTQLAGGDEYQRRRMLGPASLSRSTRGSPNASVLPDPVLAFPSTSRPSSASGMTRRLDGERRAVIPCSARMVDEIAMRSRVVRMSSG
jgi:hypothetical protein